MTFLPIVARELRVASRRRGTYWGRLGAALVPIAIAGFWLPVFSSQFSLSQGKLLFSILSWVTFVYCLLAGTRLTSDCLSVEKREGTIGLLFLTDLRGYDVILGKSASCSLHAFYGLLAVMPVLALALLLGGVMLAEVGRMALLFINTLFLSTAAGVFVSTLSRNDRRAMFAAVCVMLLVCAAPYVLVVGYAMLNWAWRGRAPQSLMDIPQLLWPSPIFAMQALRSNFFGPTMAANFYASILTSHLMGWFLLVLASLVVPRVCRERPPGRWRQRWLEFRNRWSFGRSDKRLNFRRRLLDVNAFYWLAARDRIKSRYVWFFLVSLLLIWCWAGWMMEGFIFDWDVSFWLLFLVFLFLKVWLASEVCTRLVEDRANGSFELLLSSPLDLKDIARGQWLAVRRQFGWPVLVIVAIAFWLTFSALRAPHNGLTIGGIQLLFWAMIVMLIADFITLTWVGMWQAINSSQINQASLGACSRVLLLPTVLFVVIFAFLALVLRAITGTMQEDELWKTGCWIWLGIGLTNDLFFGLRARWRFLHQFRDVATQRFVARSPGWEPFADVIRALKRRSPPAHSAPGGSASILPRGWKAWVIATPVILIALALAVFAWRRAVLHHRVEARLEQIRSRGEPVTMAELRGWLPAVLPEQNAATYYERAVPNLSLLPARTPTRRRRIEWPGSVDPVPPELKDEIAAHVQRNQQALELLHEGGRLSQSRFSIDWSQAKRYGFAWQSLGLLGSAAELLQLAALDSLEKSNSLGAAECVHTLLSLSQAAGAEPFLTPQYYRWMFGRSAVRTLERILNQAQLPVAELDRLERRLRAAETNSAQLLTRAFLSERCVETEQFLQPQTVWPMGTPTPSTGQKLLTAVQDYTADRLGLRHKALMQYLDALDEVLVRATEVDSPKSDSLRFSRSPQPQAGPGLSELRFAWDSVLMQQLDFIAQLRAAQAALAIERYRYDHEGQIPEDPKTLNLAFDHGWPRDPFGSGLLQFRRLTQGYLIYSVGQDLEDNEGRERPLSNRAEQKSAYDLPFRVSR